MSFDFEELNKLEELSKSQSLWNRAMSFDSSLRLITEINRLNPFGTGQCLSTNRFDNIAEEVAVSIPLEQGNVFRPIGIRTDNYYNGVSIPLEQGNVFRRKQSQKFVGVK